MINALVSPYTEYNHAVETPGLRYANIHHTSWKYHENCMYLAWCKKHTIAQVPGTLCNTSRRLMYQAYTQQQQCLVQYMS